ncbi:hypothetical protein ABFA07_013447 [Porites harrisoni]
MAEAPNSMQLPSGYDEDFVYEVEDDCLCLICHLPLKEPALTRCGHRFCKVCLEEHLKRQEAQNQPYTCPADREGLDRDRDVFPDNATGRKILSMVIKCPSDGCSWTGELRNKELPLREPVQTICGHRFCKACLEEHLRRQEVQNQPCTCPADREGLNRDQPDVFPDKATARKILSMVIKCPSDGCSWTGELRNKEANLEACTFKMVACTKEHCLEQVKRKDLEQHVTITCAWRIIECEYCEEPHPKRHLQVHLENCSKIPLTCSNSCGKLIPREMIPNHIDNDCPLSLVSCPLAQIGCIETVCS